MDEYIAIAKEKHGYNMEQVKTLFENYICCFKSNENVRCAIFTVCGNILVVLTMCETLFLALQRKQTTAKHTESPKSLSAR